MPLKNEIRRKLFHNLGIIYLVVYWFMPRLFSLIFFGFVLSILAGVEFIRLRRPEINAKFLARFGGIHRESEVISASGIFWTLLGCWTTMVVFTNKKIVMPAIGFLVFGDALAALGGMTWGKHPWTSNPKKTMEGSLCFAVVSALWALLFVRWPVAILGAFCAAWIEAQPYRWNDNFWIPVLSGAALSVLNLALGRG